VGTPSHGPAVISGSTITYTPTANYAGPDLFTDTIVGASGGIASASIQITIVNQLQWMIITLLQSTLPSILRLLPNYFSCIS